MTDLRQKRLDNLNKLLMEQPKYAAAIAGSSEPEASEKDKSNKSNLVDKVVDGANTVLAFKGGKSYLKKALKKAGVKGGEEVVKKGLLRRTLSNLSFRSLLLLAKEIIAFQQFSAMPVRALHGGGKLGLRAAAAAYGSGTAAASIGSAVAIGAIGGTAIGFGLNKLFSSPDLDKEVEERLNKAKKDINYAKAELDVYCKGTGALCRDDVDCSGKPGGYEYNKASGYEETLGLGTGRELFGVPGFRTFKQTPMSFHSNDGAVMVGLAFILAIDDLKNGKITLPNEENKLKKAELKQGSVSKEYEDCIKNWLTQSRVMLAQVKKLGMEKAYKELRFVYGIDALPDLPADKEGEEASTAGPAKGNECRGYPFVPGCVGDGINNMIAVLVRGTDEGQRLFQANKDKIQKLADDSVMSPEVIEFVKQVLEKENPEVLADFEAKGNKINSSSDPLSVYVNKLAKEKNISESILTERIKIDPHYVNVIKEQRLRTLNKKLMGR